ncbi:hypothetical protein BT96DRAFT_976171 [Gymnopus androsaceus JB14]|uniref:Uncharacterized protein n=1 Tax=Gymnopus androsaceus JB14 TaxID=1447944 RepID=A0A6A4HJ72_9AGAR|nr:hypothetical protein BT96DRAFT_976171 [Gymnopus androsaceus JB14]
MDGRRFLLGLLFLVLVVFVRFQVFKQSILSHWYYRYLFNISRVYDHRLEVNSRSTSSQKSRRQEWSIERRLSGEEDLVVVYIGASIDRRHRREGLWGLERISTLRWSESISACSSSSMSSARLMLALFEPIN